MIVGNKAKLLKVLRYKHKSDSLTRRRHKTRDRHQARSEQCGRYPIQSIQILKLGVVLPNSLPTGWTNPATLVLTGYCPQITILNNGFKDMIGFSVGTFPSSSTTTTNQSFVSSTLPNLSTVNSILVKSNFANNVLSKYPDVIYSFAPDVQFGSQIIKDPPNLCFIDVEAGIRQFLDITMTDQNNNAIVFNDFNVLFEIVIKSRNE
jgi:hypothetical protein